MVGHGNLDRWKAALLPGELGQALQAHARVKIYFEGLASNGGRKVNDDDKICVAENTLLCESVPRTVISLAFFC